MFSRLTKTGTSLRGSSTVSGHEANHAHLSRAKTTAEVAQDIEQSKINGLFKAHTMTRDPLHPDTGLIIIRVLSATLLKSHDMFGKMDPYAIVTWVPGIGEKVVISQTATDWNAHKTPQWEHTCRGVPYRSGLPGWLEFEVWEANLGGMGKPTFCGAANGSIDKLLKGSSADAVPQLTVGNTMVGQRHELELTCKNEVAGTLHVQVMLVELAMDDPDARPVVQLDKKMFKEPAKPLGVSGGTAAFFQLEVVEPPEGINPYHFIGKDLSRAHDELTFYEQSEKIVQQEASMMKPLLDFMFEYGGVLELKTELEEGAVKELLVLRNLFDGCHKFRMLDIKMGQKTAQAGWQGKSRSAAWRQAAIDGLTNSASEGYRLEGFDGLPDSIGSIKPLLMIHDQKTQKKLLRFLLQMMTGAEILMGFCDLHQMEHANDIDQYWSPGEYGELVMLEIIRRLVLLCLACRCSPVPQKWIGSSIALGFDSQLPTREKKADDLTKKVKVHVFDWGRSELNTVQKHQSFSDEDQRDRARFWTYYVGGVDVLTLEAMRMYWQRFAQVGTWKELVCTVFDFDTVTPSDFLARAVVPFEEVPKQTSIPLKRMGGRSKAKLWYTLKWHKFPESSRVEGVWRLTIIKCTSLPRSDFRGGSDPFIEVTAQDPTTGRSFSQRTSVKQASLDPVYDETLEIVVSRNGARLDETLSDVGCGFSGGAPPSVDLLLRFNDEVPAHHQHNNFGSSLSPSFRSSSAAVLDNSTKQASIAKWQEHLSKAHKNLFGGNEAVPEDRQETNQGMNNDYVVKQLSHKIVGTQKKLIDAVGIGKDRESTRESVEEAQISMDPSEELPQDKSSCQTTFLARCELPFESPKPPLLNPVAEAEDTPFEVQGTEGCEILAASSCFPWRKQVN